MQEGNITFQQDVRETKARYRGFPMAFLNFNVHCMIFDKRLINVIVSVLKLTLTTVEIS